MAHFSLSYIDDTPNDELGKNFAKVIHLRHAIEDLNNSFDLLLQIPWFYYRIWNKFNSGASLQTRQLKNRNEIVRNTEDWVLFAERECDFRKVMSYLKNTSNPLENRMKKFFEDYIEGTGKAFTIRTLNNYRNRKNSRTYRRIYGLYWDICNGRNIKLLNL